MKRACQLSYFCVRLPAAARRTAHCLKSVCCLEDNDGTIVYVDDCINRQWQLSFVDQRGWYRQTVNTTVPALLFNSHHCQINDNYDMIWTDQQQESWATVKMTASMRPTYGCPENFRVSLSTPTATFPEIFNGLLFRSILWMRVHNLRFVALKNSFTSSWNNRGYLKTLVIQGNWFWYQAKARMRLPISPSR